jgi:hypothetical protein
MGADTPIGRLKKFPKEDVARLGFEGLMAGVDMVVGGDESAREALERHLRTPEPAKAAAHAALVRADRPDRGQGTRLSSTAPVLLNTVIWPVANT